jgi:hypothetical protein
LAAIALFSGFGGSALDDLIALAVGAEHGMESNEGALSPLSGRFPPSAPHAGQTRFRVSRRSNPAGNHSHFRLVYWGDVLAA